MLEEETEEEKIRKTCVHICEFVNVFYLHINAFLLFIQWYTYSCTHTQWAKICPTIYLDT